MPLYLRGPNIPKKTVKRSPVVNIDVASTVLDMAGSQASWFDFDGESFLSIANGTTQDNRPRALLVEYQGEYNSRDSIDPRCPWTYDYNVSVNNYCKLTVR